LDAEALSILRNEEEKDLAAADIVIPGLKKELDPSLPEEMRSGAGYQKYFSEMMQQYEAESERDQPEEVSQTEIERAYLRLFRKVRLLSAGVMEADYKVWPINANSHEMGTMWGQPSWRLRLMRAFMSGVNTETEELQEELRRKQQDARRRNGLAH
jgi:hypothetical protein